MEIEKYLSSDVQIKSFLKIIIFSIIILFIYLLFHNKDFSQINIRTICFNVISILSGTGYVTGEFDGWGNFPLIFFLTLMFIGGCAGSTTVELKFLEFKFYIFLLLIN